jgi:hypothetical protein
VTRSDIAGICACLFPFSPLSRLHPPVGLIFFPFPSEQGNITLFNPGLSRSFHHCNIATAIFLAARNPTLEEKQTTRSKTNQMEQAAPIVNVPNKDYPKGLRLALLTIAISFTIFLISLE